GPVLEAITDGKYYWAPFERLAHVQIDPPADLRDVVWLPATFRWTAGGETFGLIPTRYPGSEADADPRVRLARFTDWRPLGEGEAEVLVGAGQRLLATDQAELAIMDVRRILLGEAAADAPGDASAGANAAGAGSGHG